MKCNHNYPFEVKNNNYSNCYKNCEHYYYFDKNNNYYCTNNLSCPIDFPTLINERRECINNNNYKSTEILIQIYSTLIKETIDYSNDAFPISNLIEPKLEDNNDIKTKIQNLLNLKNNTTFEMNEDEEIKYYDMIIKNIESIFMSPDYDTTKLDNGKD